MAQLDSDPQDRPRATTATVDALLMPALKSLGRARDHQPTPGLVDLGTSPRTGFTDLDHLTLGLHPGELWVVTGRSGAGKSVFALDVARSASVTGGARTAVVQSRDAPNDLALRLLSAQGRVPLLHLRNQNLAPADWKRVDTVLNDCSTAPLTLTHVDFPRTALTTAAGMLDVAAVVLAEQRPRLLIVDDLPASTAPAQLMELKEQAADTGACLLVVISEESSRPMFEIERDSALVADVILQISRDHELPPGDMGPRAGEADFLVLRNRHGPISCITVAFQGHYCRFVDMTPG